MNSEMRDINDSRLGASEATSEVALEYPNVSIARGAVNQIRTRPEGYEKNKGKRWRQ